jgi:23S rRNA pseudouridine1911/1915/1917 synthase
LGIPQRLDRPVSGVVVFARNTKAAQRLAEQFQRHQVEKVYWAVVDGIVTSPAGCWEDWVRKRPAEARSEVVSQEQPGARRALLHFRCLSSGDGWTLLEVRPKTGRMHQIRVQAAVRDWPVRGDVLYGSVNAFGPAAERPRDRIIALHARSLTFLHPIRFEPLTVTAPLPGSWQPFTASASG